MRGERKKQSTLTADFLPAVLEKPDGLIEQCAARHAPQASLKAVQYFRFWARLSAAAHELLHLSKHIIEPVHLCNLLIVQFFSRRLLCLQRLDVAKQLVERA